MAMVGKRKISNSVANARTVLITGASAGIGKAFAQEFARHGFNLVLVARRHDRLTAVAEQLERECGVQAKVIVADLSDPTAPRAIYDQLNQEGTVIDALVNNAGYALAKPFLDTPWQEHQALINVMMTSPTQLCHLFAPHMRERRYGRIINVASVAAFAPEFAGNLYNAAKSYIAHMSEALDLELKPHNVHCLALCPGLTLSEFHDVMGVRGALSYLPQWRWMDAQTVARQGYEAVMKGEAIYINGWVNRSLVQAFKLMPQGLRQFMSKKQIIL